MREKARERERGGGGRVKNIKRRATERYAG